jgi:hypothetical protein
MKRNYFVIILFVLLKFSSILQAQTDCINPHEISSLPFAESGLTTDGAGNNFDASDACTSTAMENQDYVFEFIPGADMQINIQLLNTTVRDNTIGQPASSDIGLFIVHGCPENPVSVCVDMVDNVEANPSLLNVSLTGGETYYIVVSSKSTTLVGFPVGTYVEFDIEITQNFSYDVGITDIFNLQTSCGYDDNVVISCEIKNFGIEDAGNFDIGYSINGGAPVYELFAPNLSQNESAIFNFAQAADLSAFGEYTIEIYTNMPTDEDNSNDMSSVVFTHIETFDSYPFTEDFEADNGGWTAGGANTSWTHGAPSAAAIINAPVSGDYCWVTNLNGEANGSENSHITSPCYDLSGLTIPTIEFSVWTDFGFFGNSANLLASRDGGLTWTDTIRNWTSSTTGWVNFFIETPELFGETQVRFRFTYAGGFSPGNGLGVDDFTVREAIMNDLAVTEILKPFSACGLTATEALQVVVKNTGNAPQTDIPLNYSLNGGANWLATPEIYNGTIEQGDSIFFTFPGDFDFSMVGEYHIHVRTENPGDEVPENDEFQAVVVNSPFYNTFPLTEDFEADNGYWYTDGTNSSWAHGAPSVSAIINAAAEGDNCWVTNLDGPANANENSRITSPCFDLTGLEIPSVEFYMWRDFGFLGNSSSLVASLDGGETWVDTLATWTASTTGWVHNYLEFPQLNAENDVKFRFTHANGFTPGNGVGIDKFTVREAFMNDVGVSAILTPNSGCGMSDEVVTIVVKNYANAAQTDIPVNLSLDGGTTWLGTPEIIEITLEPGDSVIYDFDFSPDFNMPGEYIINARTENPGDENPDNDAAERVVNSVITIDEFEYAESFEEGAAGWYAYGANSSMQLAMPAGTIINTAPDGDYAWVTNPTGFANDSEVSNLQSPCFDFSELENPVISAMIQYETAPMLSDFTVEYSLDEENWDTLEAGLAAVNWYGDDEFGGFMSSWAGNSEGWIYVKTDMPHLAGEPKVSFRFRYSAGFSLFGDSEGVAIDMIEIFDCNIFPVANYEFEVNGSIVSFTNLSENADTYLWEFNENEFMPSTSTETNPVFDFMMDGTFFVTLTAINECSSDQITLTVQIVGTDVEIIEIATQGIYPNPANAILNIVNETEELSFINIYNLNGQLIKTLSSTDSVIKINIEELAQGMYHLQIINESKTEVHTLIVE